MIRVEERRRGLTYEDRRNFEREIIKVVDEIPEKLLNAMKKVASEYSRVANELDSTYPQRLFCQNTGISNSEFNDFMCTMQEKVEKLNKYDISNIQKLQDIEFREEDARALKVYFEDFDKKYSQYEKFLNKLDLYTDMVNARFKFKSIQISNKEGLIISDDDGNKIMLSKLSSGEQETLVLFYQLIFEVPDKVMLLVDEPEISLHIAWQRMFAEDLQKIVDQKKIVALIATHSPQIVNGNWNIQKDLGKLYADRISQ